MSVTFAFKEVWTARRQSFAVEVSRHETYPEHGEGPHRWAVYAYIYPGHWHFDKFDGESHFQKATDAMPLHAGCSFLRSHMSRDGGCSSIQVGADYHHLHDERFTFYATKEQAKEVFDDAEKLFEWLDKQEAI